MTQLTQFNIMNDPDFVFIRLDQPEEKKVVVKNYDQEYIYILFILVIVSLIAMCLKDMQGTKQKEMITLQAPVTSEMLAGVDFSYFNAGLEHPEDVLAKMHYKNLKVFAIAHNKGAVALLDDGGRLEMSSENGAYVYYIYFPKQPKIVSADETNIVLQDYNGTYFFTMKYGEEIQGDLEVPIHVTYEDGTEESIEVFVTKDYIS